MENYTLERRPAVRNSLPNPVLRNTASPQKPRSEFPSNYNHVLAQDSCDKRCAHKRCVHPTEGQAESTDVHIASFHHSKAECPNPFINTRQNIGDKDLSRGGMSNIYSVKYNIKHKTKWVLGSLNKPDIDIHILKSCLS